MLMWISLSDQHPVSAPIAQWGIWISVMFHLSHWGTYLSSGTWPCSHILATKRWQHEKATTSAIITCQPLIIKLHVVVLDQNYLMPKFPFKQYMCQKDLIFLFGLIKYQLRSENVCCLFFPFFCCMFCENLSVKHCLTCHICCDCRRRKQAGYFGLSIWRSPQF